MNILEMLDFDFMGFVASPAGILIIVGILCLLIGIVMFLKEGKNKSITEVTDKPETFEKKNETENTNVETTTEVVTTPVTTPVVVPSEGDGVKEVAVEPVAETINFTEPVTEAPKVEELKAEPLDMPVVTPVEPVTEAPAVEPVTTAPVVESLDAEVTTQPVVYGGASPEVLNTEVLEEKPREIYGGANPLENTSPIPVVNESPTVAPTVAHVEPVTEAPAVAHVEPVTEAPAVVAPTVAPVQENKEELEKLEF